MTEQIPLTKGKFAIVDNEDYAYLSQWKWCYVAGGYAMRAEGPRRNKQYVYMHRTITAAPAGVEVDHINGNGLDNRRSNLRLAIGNQNHRNKRKQPGKSSQYKGVCWFAARNKWKASITVNYKQMFLGDFDDEIEAAKAYDEAARRLFGEFALLNLEDYHG